MARLEIVAPGAAHAVVFATKSLWIAPDLWKTPRTRFPQGLWTRTERAPTRSTGRSFQSDGRQGKDTGAVRISLMRMSMRRFTRLTNGVLKEAGESRCVRCATLCSSAARMARSAWLPRWKPGSQITCGASKIWSASWIDVAR